MSGSHSSLRDGNGFLGLFKRGAAALAVALTLAMVSPAQAAPRTLSKDQRVLLIVSNLSTGANQYEALYEFIEAQGVSMAQDRLASKYRRIYVLTGAQATRANFIDYLSRLAASRDNLAIDVLIHLHGSPGRLHFVGGSATTARLGTDISARGLSGKGRIVYSSACHGSTHIQDFITAGFLAGSGARAVNAASSYEYPEFLRQWGANVSFGTAMSRADDPSARNASDWTATHIMGFNNVDSRKITSGRTTSRINLDPTSVR